MTTSKSSRQAVRCSLSGGGAFAAGGALHYLAAAFLLPATAPPPVGPAWMNPFSLRTSRAQLTINLKRSGPAPPNTHTARRTVS